MFMGKIATWAGEITYASFKSFKGTTHHLRQWVHYVYCELYQANLTTATTFEKPAAEIVSELVCCVWRRQSNYWPT